MAQHHSLMHTKSPLDKTYQRVLDAMKNRAMRGFAGSLKFEELPETHRLTANDRAYIT